MWSLHASLDLPGLALPGRRKSQTHDLTNGPLTSGAGASILGVGHFTVPPDVSVDGPAGHQPADGAPTIRTIVVPHGIAAVPRRSPIKSRPRTPWRSTPEAGVAVERADHREWFTERLFIESKPANLPAACSRSALVHAVLVILVLLFLAARAARTGNPLPAHVDVSLRMPVLSQPLPAVVPPAAGQSVARRSPPRSEPPQAPASVSPVEAAATVPFDMPSGVEPEPVMIDDGPGESAPVGDEIAGVAGGIGPGPSLDAAPAPAAAGPLRAGEGIDRPRKIKDVKPVYPLPAMVAQVRGNVVIEATIGADGKVHQARVLRSIAALDQAALNAVRQWEFEPSRINGVAVAVTMVIVVTFSLL